MQEVGKIQKAKEVEKILTKEVKYRNTGNENSPFDDRVLKSSFSLKEIQNKGIYYCKKKNIIYPVNTFSVK